MGGLLHYHYPIEGQNVIQIAGWSPPSSLILLIPILIFGSLITGILVTQLAPEAEGHGTDAAIKAFHGTGKIRARVPVIKALTAIATIATGGSAGREGPTAQISAGFGSIVADRMGLSEKERRIALTTGIGAGIGTIFKAPLGGAVLAAEILYTRDFEADAIIPAFLASIVGYAIFGFFEGYDAIFSLTPLAWSVSQIPLFLLLGIFCAFFGLLYIWTFYWTKDQFSFFFSKHNLPLFLKPVLGAVLIGILVIVLSFVSPEGETLGLAGLGSGYGFTQLMLYSMLPLAVVLFLPIIKILTTSLTLGSGGSGGVFAPGLMVGAATGASVGILFHWFFPALVPVESVPVFVIVGMISLFGAVANAPIAVMIMVVEMTGSFSLLVPAMGAVAVSCLLTGEKTIFREQVPTKAQSGAHRGEFNREMLEGIKVNDVMIQRSRVSTFAPGDPIGAVLTRLGTTTHTGFPVLENDRLFGIITINDVQNIPHEPGKSQIVAGHMIKNIDVIYPDNSLEDALAMMVTHNISHLPVVSREDNGCLVGLLTRTDILRTYARHSASMHPLETKS
ncbi:MAG: chloride channel protein [Methanoregula sp.]